jgi:hypothetical protein
MINWLATVAVHDVTLTVVIPAIVMLLGGLVQGVVERPLSRDHLILGKEMVSSALTLSLRRLGSPYSAVYLPPQSSTRERVFPALLASGEGSYQR